jgi:hypothetical protein
MKKSTKAVIVGAAMAGLFTGAAARVHAAAVLNGSAGTSINQMEDSGKDSDKDKHSCKGQNSCKGKGGCKSDSNSCKGQNSCKGKGGCATDGSKKSDM